MPSFGSSKARGAGASEPSASLSPKLRLEPVTYSLTDGTSIPAPEATPTESPTEPPKVLGGPLSSHPVTPVEPANGQAMQFFGSSSSAGNPSKNPERPDSKAESMAGLNETRPRQASFATRFLRLRSLSSLKGGNKNNTSETSLGQYDGSGYNTPSVGSPRDTPGNPTLRGTKRSMELLSSKGNTGQSFPRMMRKKSMDMLNSVRRRSGMWGGSSMDLTKDVEDEDGAYTSNGTAAQGKRRKGDGGAPKLALPSFEDDALPGLEKQLMSVGRSSKT